MSFVHRRIEISVELGEGSFGEDGADKVTLSGIRTQVVINKDGIPSQNSATLRVYGMDQSTMNRISRIGLLPVGTRNNIVTISAGDDEVGMSQCFAGVIIDAWPDFQSMPDVAFCITASTGSLAAVKPAEASSFPNDADVAEILKGLAAQMGYKFENNGVSVMLSTPYFWGSARQQALSAAAAAGIIVVFDDDNGVMAILPRNGFRAGSIPLISAATGMVSYPSYCGPGQILVRTLYNPTVQFAGQIEIQTSLDTPDVTHPASGLWRVNHLTHILDAETPNGSWFTEIVGGLYNSGRTTP